MHIILLFLCTFVCGIHSSTKVCVLVSTYTYLEQVHIHEFSILFGNFVSRKNWMIFFCSTKRHLAVCTRRADKYLSHKWKTKIVEKWRFIVQHCLLLVRYTWPNDGSYFFNPSEKTFYGCLKIGIRRVDNLFIQLKFPSGEWIFQVWKEKKPHRAKSVEYVGRGRCS